MTTALAGMWQWLHGLSPGQATFLGSLTGSSIGLIALLLGALFNAHLNRRRDDRLRQEERKVVAAGLLAELVGLSNRLHSTTKLLKDGLELKGPMVSPFPVPDLAHSVRVLPHLLSKLGLLDPETIRSVIDAHLAIEQHKDELLQWGGRLRDDLPSHGRVVDIPSEYFGLVVVTNEHLFGKIQTAIEKLEVNARPKPEPVSWWRWPRTTR